MATIAENLQEIINCKTDIKNALIEKGVEPTKGMREYPIDILKLKCPHIDENMFYFPFESLGYSKEECYNAAKALQLLIDYDAKSPDTIVQGAHYIWSDSHTVDIEKESSFNENRFIPKKEYYIDRYNPSYTDPLPSGKWIFWRLKPLFSPHSYVPFLDINKITGGIDGLYVGLGENMTFDYTSDFSGGMSIGRDWVDKELGYIYLPGIYGGTNIKYLDINFPNSYTVNRICSGMDFLEEAHVKLPKANSAKYLFEYSKNLHTIDIEIPQAIKLDDMFYKSPNVKNIIHMKGLCGDIDFSPCPLLTHESLLTVFNEAAHVEGKTMILGPENKKKVSAKEIEIVTNKGWIVK